METKETVLEIQMKKSALVANNERAYAYITDDEQGLLPCKIELQGDGVLFHFDIKDKSRFSELKTEELEYKYRFLQNFYEMKENWKNYILLMSEENIFYDCNFMPYFAVRDVKTSDEEELTFLEEYQYLAAGLLNKKYSYKQVKESGKEIVRKDRGASWVFECETTEELYEVIKARAEEIHEINKSQKIRIEKRKYQMRNRIVTTVIGSLVLLLLISGYFSLVVLPRNQAVVRASRAYTIENYVECIDSLRNIEPEQMDTYTKYILAVSYARSEALEKEELTYVLDRLSIYSNAIELEYWIAIGRSDFELAENFSKALSDDKLLIYAYMKELNYLEGNVTMDGEEKQNRMTELSNAITEIGKKYTEEE